MTTVEMPKRGTCSRCGYADGLVVQVYHPSRRATVPECLVIGDCDARLRAQQPTPPERRHGGAIVRVLTKLW